MSALSKYYYDPLYQLTRVDYPTASPFNSEVDSFTYDDIGNRLTFTVNGLPATYTYLKNGANPLNGQRLSSDGVNSYTWDNNGSNLTRNGSPGNFTFSYSVDNRLTTITGALAAGYTYDYQGRRTSKTVSGVTTTYLYDGLNLLTETTLGNPVNYLFGPGIDEPLATSQGVNVGYFSVDGLGTTGVISTPTGTVQNSYVFDAWGAARSSSATLTNSFGYTGREFAEAGLLFYRARFLQTGAGRFTTEDPINRDAYENRLSSPAPSREPSFDANWIQPLTPPQFAEYPYVGNDPVFTTDPTGKDPRDWWQGWNLVKYLKCTWQHIGCTNGVDRSCRCRSYSSPYGVYNCMFNGYNCCDRKFLICRWGLAYRLGKAAGIVDPTPPPDNCAGSS